MTPIGVQSMGDLSAIEGASPPVTASTRQPPMAAMVVGSEYDSKVARPLTAVGNGLRFDLETETWVVEDAQAFRKSRRAHHDDDYETWQSDGVANTLNSHDNTDVRTTHAVVEPELTVRRLTPLECERLQGFPDGWTDVDGASDSARYKQLGNAVAVPSAQWIAANLADVDRELS